MASPTSETPWKFSQSSGSADTDALLGGTQYQSTSLTFSFAEFSSSWSTAAFGSGGYGATTGDGEPWSAEFDALAVSDRVAVRDAMDSWAAVSGLQLTEVTETSTVVGDLRLGYTWTPEMEGAQAYAYLPGSGPRAGDIWFNTRGTSYEYAWDPSTYEYQTVVHEIGHALGLKHPFEDDPTLPLQLDSRSFTVMSYSAQPGNQNSYFSYEPTTPMILDIAAIQHLYGVNPTTNAGNTTYTFTGDGLYHFTICDASGTDTFVNQSTTGCSINLAAGVGGGSRLGQALGVYNASNTLLYTTFNVWIANGTIIENATGGSGSDVIYGNQVGNRLDGGAGNDTIVGLAGNDTLIGGSGVDSLTGGTGNDVYSVDNVGDVVTEVAGAGSDTLVINRTVTLTGQFTNIEHLTLGGAAAINGTGNTAANRITGNSAANSLSGGSGNDTLSGGAGNDTLNGGTSNDSMVGGDGNDTYIVNVAGDIVNEVGTVSSTIDLVQSSVSWTLGANLERLTLTGTTAINGTGNTLANLITGNAANNSLNGGSGDDTLVGNAGNDTLNGSTGNDSMVGGDGNDTYVVNVAGDKVSELGTVSSTQDLVQSGVTWTLGANLERLTLTTTAAINGTGNTLANLITGNSAANVLSGGSGNDTLNGSTGNDTLIGGLGNDSLIGGAGIDVYRFSSALSAATNVDRLSGFVAADDSVQLDDAVFAGIGAIGALGAARFRAATVAGDASDRVIYNAATGQIFFDADGSGAAAQVLFATVTAGTAITTADFFVI